MKLYFLIIILSFIGPILNSDYEYDLMSGKSKFVDTLDKKKSYKFYISAIYNHKVYIKFTKSDSSSTSYESIKIYEYGDRNGTRLIGWTSYNYLSYSSSTNSYSYTYLVFYEGCKYLAFEIHPLYSMYSAYVEATFIYEYDLTIGSSIHFNVLSTSYIYRFFISAQYNQKINIEFQKNDSLSTSSQSITIYELSKKSISAREIYEINNLNYSSAKNSYSISYNIISFFCKYLAFEIFPYYEMSNTYVKVTNISKAPNNDDDDLASDSSDIFWAAVILIPIINVVIISLLVWYCTRKKNEKVISFENTSTQPLYPLQANKDQPI